MWAGIGLLAAIVLALFVFGGLGIYVAGRFARSSDGSANSSNEAGFFWIFGGLGALLVVWLLNMMFGN